MTTTELPPVQTVVLVAATYAVIDVCIGPIFGRVSGVLIAFLDVGIAQSPMLRGEPVDWARLLPGYGADRVLLDGRLTASFDEPGALLLVLAVAATRLFRRGTS